MNVEALARELAHDKCFEADVEGYGFSTENPEDIEHFMDSARDRAKRYANILAGTPDFTIEDMEEGQRAVLDGKTAVEALVDASIMLEKILSLHFPVTEDGEPVGCQCCDWDYGKNWTWPCETFRAAGGVA